MNDRRGRPLNVGTGDLAQLTDVSQLPPKAELARYIRQAMVLNENGTPSPPMGRSKVRKPPPRVPADLTALLLRDRKARATFEGFSPSRRREYVEWITEAKTDDTRTRRLAKTIEWLRAGKPRNWKYLK